MTTLIDDTRVCAIASSDTQYFYFYMALSCTAVAFLGFAPTYWLPMASRAFPPMPVVHIHGLCIFRFRLGLPPRGGSRGIDRSG